MLKIDENSLQNSIIKDGQIVIGQVGTDSCIYSSATSSIVHGYANNNSKIYTNEDTFGSYAGGYTDENSYIVADGNGAHAEGHAEFGGYVYSKQDLINDGSEDYFVISAVRNRTTIIITFSHEFSNRPDAEDWWRYNSDDVCRLLQSFPNLSTEGKYNDYDYWFNCFRYIDYSVENIGTTWFISIQYEIKVRGSNSLTVGRICIPKREMVYASINAIGNGSHAEGYANNSSISAIGNGSHAEGYANPDGSIKAEGIGAHAEGIDTQAIGDGAHAEGYNTKASDNYSHAEGYNTIASGQFSHAEGFSTEASKSYSHASGQGTIADQTNQFVCGKYNTQNNVGALFVVGNGQDKYATSDAFTIYNNGSYRFDNMVYIDHNIGEDDGWPYEEETFPITLYSGTYRNYTNSEQQNYNVSTYIKKTTIGSGVLAKTTYSSNTCLIINKKYINKIKIDKPASLIRRSIADDGIMEVNQPNIPIYFGSNIFKEGDEITLIIPKNPQNSENTPYRITAYSQNLETTTQFNLLCGAFKLCFSNDTEVITAFSPLSPMPPLVVVARIPYIINMQPTS